MYGDLFNWNDVAHSVILKWYEKKTRGGTMNQTINQGIVDYVRTRSGDARFGNYDSKRNIFFLLSLDFDSIDERIDCDDIVARIDFERFLSRLNDRDRTIVVLRLKWQFTCAEIGEVLGCSHVTIYNQLELIKKELITLGNKFMENNLTPMPAHV